MKKLIAVSLIALALVGCGTKEEVPSVPAAPEVPVSDVVTADSEVKAEVPAVEAVPVQ
jgi:uncharacterized protein YcfL